MHNVFLFLYLVEDQGIAIKELDGLINRSIFLLKGYAETDYNSKNISRGAIIGVIQIFLFLCPLLIENQLVG